MQFDIVVTMVNTNEKELIKGCLTSLWVDTKDDNLKVAIVIVDNNSTEDIEPMLNEQFKDSFAFVRLIRQEKNEGFGKSHNKAMSAVEGKYYFILNPDTHFKAGQHMLKKMYAFMEENENIGMIGPRIIYPDGNIQYSCYRFPTFLQPLYSRTKLGRSGNGKKIADHFLMKDFEHNATIPVDWIMGSAMFTRKKVIDEVGGFDDRFWMYAEDSDWCRRLWEHNWPVYYFHEVTIEHIHRRASADVPGVIKAMLKNKFARQHLRSWIKYFWKWRGNHKYYQSKLK
ncbi:MAG: hypothetical protein COV59_02450 [Candidatus Magasanikbacteria bacterium CG11_big_fil_rev_8_21_14_0_20_39_34]|uniref:Glycosyltransferase 2-like domain-containing protein n=1 Tax=Candidatus Magasanikbacteria bacterium CG11_big_fil_rev_8_21_14_0_20_39_34 TaxID=1974653 RepID=A0A2H0N551_9BACT|nr:MAG: hypothetical protein COV59_02450 [Candidatus Magasanikbacteria bacterium CG11_big_fil_rev_8_21_14_0_20_39_34]